MRSRQMRNRRRTGVAVAALSAAVLVGGGAAYAVTQTMSETADAPAAGMRTAHVAGTGMGPDMGMGRFTEDLPFDAQFLDQMAVHHQGAIMSTQAMIADSDRPELRALAQDILTSQREQLTQMRAWREQWYPDLAPTFGMTGSMMGGSMMGGDVGTDGSDPMGMMGGSMMGGDAGTDGSDPMGMMGGSMMGGDAGTERMYLQMMIVHHQLAVDMAEQAQREAVHPELRALAAVIAQEQAAQITQMRGYLAAAAEPAGG